MRKILITGSSGFIGKNLVKHFEGCHEVLHPSHKQLDLLMDDSVEAFLKKEQVDIVIHTAVQGTLGMPKEYERKVLKNNLKMFLNLERCNQHYKKMYYFGSGAEYGKKAYIPRMQESYFDAVVPEDDYGLSKYVIAKISENKDNIYNLRLFGVFGPYENYNYRFISNSICKMIQEKDIRIRQNMNFDYMYIKDLCEIMDWFIESEPKYRQYNICTGTGVSIYKIAEIIQSKLKGNIKIICENDKLNMEYTGDNSRIINEMGGFHFTPLETAIEEMIDFYLKYPFKLEGNY